MKNCPFCKNTITENNDTCPHCHRVLVERIYSNFAHTSQTTNQDAKIPTSKQSKKYFKQVSNRFKNLKWNKFKKYVPIFVLLLLVIFFSIQKEKNNTRTINNSAPVSVIPNNENPSVELNDTSAVKIKDPKTYTSLLNGTALSKNFYYFKGLGQLKIDNGTSLDAIAKLVNIATNKSVLTVYIKANSTYNINEISNGNYKLFFNLGNDWDTEFKAFAVNSSYEVFEENFDFTTSEYKDGTEYQTFRVTLNPVIGGQAETDEINAIEFGSY